MSQLARLAYEHSLRSLDHQAQLLEELRSRTGVLLAATAIAGSVIGNRILDAGDPGWQGIVALAALGGSALLSLVLLLPEEPLALIFRGSRLYEGLFDIRHDETEQLRRLTYWMTDDYDENRRKIAAKSALLRLAIVALVIGFLFGGWQLLAPLH